MKDSDRLRAPNATNGFTSYSLNFEDVMLHRLFAGRGPGFYIDVGAGHPLWENDTRALYEAGWHGINVEPNESFFRALQLERPRDRNLCLALSDEADEGIVYYEISDTGLSTCDAALARVNESRGHEVRLRRVPVSTLAHILHEAGAPAVDLLKVDVEGMEERVLAGNDWERFRPKVILVEATFPESPDRRPTNVQPFLEAQGYRHAYFDGLNDFYLERGFDVGNAFALPPNVFDGFTSGEIVHLRAENRYLKLDLDDFRGENRRLKAAVEEMHNEILALSRTIDSMHRLSSGLAESELRLKSALESELRLKSALAEHQQRASMFETQLLGLTSSTSWRLTEPLRRLAGKGSLRTRRNLRRALKAAWWIMTPWQMPARIRVIRERKIASKAVPSQNPSESRAGVNDGGRKLQ